MGHRSGARFWNLRRRLRRARSSAHTLLGSWGFRFLLLLRTATSGGSTLDTRSLGHADITRLVIHLWFMQTRLFDRFTYRRKLVTCRGWVLRRGLLVTIQLWRFQLDQCQGNHLRRWLACQFYVLRMLPC